MLPVIALVGRPNVGKSTFFNRLTRTQDALVGDFAGLTRDRQYGRAVFEQKAYIVIDTGGIGVEDAQIDALMSKQSTIALQEASVIFFMVDGRAGLTSTDQTIGTYLRKLNKPIYLVVNKADGMDSVLAVSEFQGLGFQTVFPVSATHGRGVIQLLQHFWTFLEGKNDDSLTEKDAEDVDNALETQALDKNAVKIAFVGRPNVGKSTLVNRILGEERVVCYDSPGTTRDSIYIPFKRDEKSYTLIDTAGIRRRSRVDEKIEKFSIVKSLQAIEDAQVCILLIDAQEGVTEQDLNLLSLVVEAGRALVIAVNKWDGLDLDHKEQVKGALERRLNFVYFSKPRLISARYGSGVGLLFQAIDEAYKSATQPLSTPKLTRLLQDMVAKNPPPLVNGRRIKLRYAHAGGHNPPVVVLHGNQLEALPQHYQRYLIKTFVTQLQLVGTPLKLVFKTTANPYEGKRNKLTPRQMRSRKRIRKMKS